MEKTITTVMEMDKAISAIINYGHDSGILSTDVTVCYRVGHVNDPEVVYTESLTAGEELISDYNEMLRLFPADGNSNIATIFNSIEALLQQGVNAYTPQFLDGASDLESLQATLESEAFIAAMVLLPQSYGDMHKVKDLIIDKVSYCTALTGEIGNLMSDIFIRAVAARVRLTNGDIGEFSHWIKWLKASKELSEKDLGTTALLEKAASDILITDGAFNSVAFKQLADMGLVVVEDSFGWLSGKVVIDNVRSIAFG